MASFIDENTQFVGVNGKPLNNGKIYIGVQGQDPVINPTPIFSNRALTISLTNPQTLNSLGRSTNKIWIPGKYSLRVEDTAAQQNVEELDQGETETVGNTVLSNVQGTNAITATASPTITSLVDKTQFVFTAVATNTAAVTLKIDGTAAKAIVNGTGGALVAGDIQVNTVINVNFDSIGDRFQLIGGGFSGVLGTALDTNGFPINTSRFTVASAATTADIWASPGGNEVDFTGSATVTDFPNAPRAGASRILHCAGAVVFTNNATLFVMGAANFTAAAGDIVWVHAITVSTFRLVILKADGLPVVNQSNVQSTIKTDTFTTTSQSFVDIIGLSVSITPSSTNSKILLLWQVTGSNTTSSGGATIGIFSNSTQISLGDAAGSRTRGSNALNVTGSAVNITGAGNFLDSPATISAIVYKVQVKTQAASTIFINRTVSDSNSATYSRTVCNITAIEIF